MKTLKFLFRFKPVHTPLIYFYFNEDLDYDDTFET